MANSIKLSWTKLSTLESCDLRYHLKYVAKTKSRDTGEAMIVGLALHNAVETWSKTGYKEKQLSHLATDQYEKLMKNRYSSKFVQNRNKVSAAGYYTEEMYRELKAPEHGIIEYKINTSNFTLPDTILNGIIDLYLPDRQIIYDLKCSASENYKPSFGQLVLYAYIMQKNGQDIRKVGFLFPLRKNKIQHMEITDELLKEFEKRLELPANRIKSGELLKKPKPKRSKACHLCEYRDTEGCPPEEILELFTVPITKK